MRIVLTGAAGKIGSVVWRRLAADGHDVVAVDRRPISGFQPPAGELIAGDLLAPEFIDRVLAGADAVVHLANYKGVGAAPNPRLIGENVGVNATLFQAAAELGLKKIVFSSTIQVHAGSKPVPGASGPCVLPYLPADGELPAAARNSYALSKEVSEVILRRLQAWHGFQAVAIRYPLVADGMAGKNPPPAPEQAELGATFAWLGLDDAAALVSDIILQDLPGYRVYAPAARAPSISLTPEEIIRRYYPGLPLKRPLEQIDALVDVSAITRDIGWRPSA